MDTTIHPNELSQAPQNGVFLDRAIYQKLLEALNAIHAQEVESQPSLEDLLDRVVLKKERVTLTYQDKLFLAAVPIEEVDLIEQLEDCIDTKAVQEALKEAEVKGTITSEQLDKQLGW